MYYRVVLASAEVVYDLLNNETLRVSCAQDQSGAFVVYVPHGLLTDGAESAHFHDLEPAMERWMQEVKAAIFASLEH